MTVLIRKYRAKNLKEALAQIKDDLGDAATILTTRTVRSGLMSSQLEVTATLPPMQTPVATAAPPSLPPPAPSLQVQDVARFLSPLRQDVRAIYGEVRALAASSKRVEQVEDAVGELRDLLRTLRQSSQPSPPMAPLVSLQEKLLDSGMRASLVERLLDAVSTQLPPDSLEAEACAAGLAAAAMSADLRCSPPLEQCAPPCRAALIGPSGVGKTTTLAKIATRAALVHDRSVAVVGCDSERIGAMRSLREMAQLIGIPFEAARDADDLCRVLDRLAGSDLILVDTSGHSPRDAAAIAALRRMLAEADVEPLLVLNADMRIAELDANLASFAMVQPRALIFTKIDQAVGLGGLYDAALSSELPVMYLTCGRRIPEDIEEATPERVASLVLGLQLN